MNNKKLASHIQDFGALIALVLLVVVIGVISPEFRTLSNFYHCSDSLPSTDSSHLV
ncbi:MAG: hypothetical protein ACLVJC_01195 [Dorea formicigenerans]